MKSVVCSLICFLLFSSFLNKHEKNRTSNETPSLVLSFENTDHELLNQIVFQLINIERLRRKLDTLAFNTSLYQIARKSQSTLEFRTFNNPLKIQSKINRKLNEKAKKMGYKGGILVSLASQHNAIDYEKGKEFFHKKNDKTNKLGLYYGTKKDLKNPSITVLKIPNYTYIEFASALLKNLSSKQKKILYNASYRDLGLQLNWYYKSLHKRKIPQIKLVTILGGYMTDGIR
jgi:hypothetical protein